MKHVHYYAQPVDGVDFTVSNVILRDDGAICLGGFEQVGRYRILRADPL